MYLFGSNFYPRKFTSTLFLISRSCSNKVGPKDKTKSTVDESEVNFYSNMSKDWWDENGGVKLLHAMNKIRVQFMRSGLINTGLLNAAETNHNPLYLKGLKIADVGCGGGILSLKLASLGSDVVGIEPSEELVNVAKGAVERFKPAGKAEFLATSVEDYAKTKAESVDAVVCSEVIEHITQKDGFVEACVKIIKPGGSIFFTTPNRTLLGKLITIYTAEYLLKLIPKGTHQYEKFILPEELGLMLSKNSCETKMVKGFIYSPLNNTFYWTSSTALFYALHAVKKK